MKFNTKKKIKIENKYIFSALIAAIVICFTFLIFSSPSNESQEVMDELADLTTSIHDNFQTKPDYWGLNTKFVIDNKLVPDSMIKDNKIISILGNEIEIGADEYASLSMPGTQSFSVIYKNVSRKDCVILSSYHLDYAEKIGLLNIKIKNTYETKEFSWGGDNKLPISVSEAKNNCLNSENSIIWTFK